jgi:hypothetical protein
LEAQPATCSQLRSFQVLKKLDSPPSDYVDLHAFRKIVEGRAAESIEALGPPPPDIKQTDPQPTHRHVSDRFLSLSDCSDAKGITEAAFALAHPARGCRNFVQAMCISAAYQLAPEHPPEIGCRINLASSLEGLRPVRPVRPLTPCTQRLPQRGVLVKVRSFQYYAQTSTARTNECPRQGASASYQQ